MRVHLVGRPRTSSFRFHYARSNRDPRRGAQRGVLNSMLDMVAEGATHIGIATDHVIESFRNEMLAGYKDGSGVDPDLKAQFPELEELLELAGFAVWPQVEHEADDGLASAAAVAASDPARGAGGDLHAGQGPGPMCHRRRPGGAVRPPAARVLRPRRGSGQVRRAARLDPRLSGSRGRLRRRVPGLPGWGAKSAATLLARYGHITSIPFDVADWDVEVRGAAKLAAALRHGFEDALLYRRIATVELGAPVSATVAEMEWRGPRPGLDERCAELGAERLAARAHQLAPQ